MPGFPAQYKAEAEKGAAFLARLQQEGLSWTFLSPSALIDFGNRTAKFRFGTDELLVDSTGMDFA
jgi:putative NADH-flavin reductase